MKPSAIVLISCPDQKGINAAIADFIFRNNGNIVHADEHQDAEEQLFLMRVEWELEGFAIAPADFEREFTPLAQRFGMQWRMALSTYKPRVAVFVSQYDHCLVDVLFRHRSGELPCEISVIVSNHPDARRDADFHGIPFHMIPVWPEVKPVAERKQLDLLREMNIDLVVLARYMQILSPDFVRHYPQRIINIHHSFLPAFVGAKPHRQAYQRGVKLIGATAHYVTETLDDGPIIEQDVVRVSHRDAVEDLAQKGRDLEKIVLSRALRWHLENRILVYGKKTVIFD
ncbi:MAG: formyltetrahydrofolate deformylase [Candidatus Acidiferrales bacterium]